jgi:hypothetical protein
MTMPNAAEIARISAALVEAMAEASERVAAGDFGADLADLLQHAPDLHQMIGEELETVGSSVGEYAGGLYAGMGDKLKELEALMRQDPQ